MATPYTGTAGVFSTLSTDTQVNSLLVGAKWESPVLSYSFITAQSTFSTSPINGYRLQTRLPTEPWSPSLSYFTSTSEQAASTALAKWAAVSNLSFSQVVDAQGFCGDIRFGFTDVGDSQAAAYSPSVGAGGDVWFNYQERLNSFAEGSYNYLTLVHEIGHALGLKHPFSASTSNSVIISRKLDSQSLTVMSYAAQAGDISTDFSFRPTTPMVLDIQAIQHLYGANTSYNTGSTEYTFLQGGQYHQTIWDAGGLDTITYSGSDNCVIDLRQGAGSTLGNPVYITDMFGNRKGAVSNVWIAKGVQIENAAAGAGADRITGNNGGNSLSGGGGNDILDGGGGLDRIDGGSGADIALFSGNAADYTVTFNPLSGRYTVGDSNRARDGSDVVSSVESFQFSDGIRSASQLAISAQVGGNVRAVLGLNEAFFGIAPSLEAGATAMQVISRDSASSYAIGLGSGFASSDHAALASNVLSNFGIAADTLGGGSPETSYALLLDALTGVFGVYSDSIGQVVLNIVNLAELLETDSVYGTAAAVFNNHLASDFNAIAAVVLAGVSSAEPVAV